MEVELQTLRDELVVLRNEFKHLSREQRLDDIAGEQLDMDVIKPEQIVSPRKSWVSVLPQRVWKLSLNKSYTNGRRR